MQKLFVPKPIGRGLLVAAIGAIAVACVTYFANLYVDSWHLAAQPYKPAWVGFFRAWEYMCMNELRSLGFGYPNSTGLFFFSDICSECSPGIYLFDRSSRYLAVLQAV